MPREPRALPPSSRPLPPLSYLAPSSTHQPWTCHASEAQTTCLSTCRLDLRVHVSRARRLTSLGQSPRPSRLPTVTKNLPLRPSRTKTPTWTLTTLNLLRLSIAPCDERLKFPLLSPQDHCLSATASVFTENNTVRLSNSSHSPTLHPKPSPENRYVTFASETCPSSCHRGPLFFFLFFWPTPASKPEYKNWRPQRYSPSFVAPLPRLLPLAHPQYPKSTLIASNTILIVYLEHSKRAAQATLSPI